MQFSSRPSRSSFSPLVRSPLVCVPQKKIPARDEIPAQTANNFFRRQKITADGTVKKTTAIRASLQGVRGRRPKRFFRFNFLFRKNKRISPAAKRTCGRRDRTTDRPCERSIPWQANIDGCGHTAHSRACPRTSRLPIQDNRCARGGHGSDASCPYAR